jgi:hypothetical protein
MQKIEKIAAIILILTFAASLAMSLPTVQAQANTITTYAFIDAVPNPVGVGEQVLLRYGVLQQLGYPADQWKGLSITIVKPDNTTQTLTDLTTDSTGGSDVVYTPDKVGTYKLTTNFPEQAFPETYFDYQRGVMFFAGDVVKAAKSDTLELVVTQEPLPNYPGIPLPTEYWSRPVDPQLREWYSITGNWVIRPDNSLALYNDYAPETAHVLWAKPLTTGGLAGGLLNGVPAGSETGDAYAGKFINSVILNGILYYNRDEDYAGQKGIIAVDLHTGEELWFRNNTYLSFGQVFYFNSFNYDGVYTYLWDTTGGSTWNAYDPFTGEWTYTMINMPSGTQVFGPSGEILIYQIDYANLWMALWNSTAAGQTAPNFASDPTTAGSWSNYWGGPLVSGSTINASDPRCYSWNVTIPAGLTPFSVGLFASTTKIYPEDRVVAISFNQTNVRVWALNLDGVGPSSTSITSTMFDKWWIAPTEWVSGSLTIESLSATNEAKNGVISIWAKELRKHYGFSTETGDYLWQTDSENWLDSYGAGSMEHSWFYAYGNLYSAGVGGIVYCYSQTTGKTLWTYNLTDQYNEPVTGNYWWAWTAVIADGKIYVGHTEHSAENPMPRGAPFICLNATTGDVIWRVNGMFRQTRWGGAAIMGDSIIATMDTYDQRIWAIGKGPSDISVMASPKVSVEGGSVLVEGMVTDISAGTKDEALAARFPHGVPAVSDANMSDWMLYVYKQFPRPTDAVGVKVTVSVQDPNNNRYDVGTATSDIDGFFKLSFTPEVPGEYTVYATFAGSNAYYGSHTLTAISVEKAPQATPVPTNPPANAADLYLLPGIGAIIAAIAVVGAIVILILRRK